MCEEREKLYPGPGGQQIHVIATRGDFLRSLIIKRVKNNWLIRLGEEDFIARTPNGAINQLTKYLKSVFNHQEDKPEEKVEGVKAL